MTRELCAHPPSERCHQAIVVGPALVIERDNLAKARIGRGGGQSSQARLRVRISKELRNRLVETVITDVVHREQILVAESVLHFGIPLKILRGVEVLGNREEIGRRKEGNLGL